MAYSANQMNKIISHAKNDPTLINYFTKQKTTKNRKKRKKINHPPPDGAFAM